MKLSDALVPGLPWPDVKAGWWVPSPSISFPVRFVGGDKDGMEGTGSRERYTLKERWEDGVRFVECYELRLVDDIAYADDDGRYPCDYKGWVISHT